MALLKRWVEAQNAGDFAAYEQMYAAKFLGIKRAGERTTSFPRRPWMNDRERMFAKPMKVEAVDPVVRTGGDSAEITFTQRWASGTYSDVGPKQLLIVREGGDLRIASEEMQRSELLEASAKSKKLDFHFTLALPDGLYMVLPEEKAPASHGEITPLTSESIYTNTAKLDEGALPASLKAWKTEKVRLDDGCVAEVESIVLLSRVEPHFGTVQTWRGTGDTPGPALDAKTVATQAFALTEPQVALKLRGCSKGTFAQRTEAPALVAAEPVADDKLREDARTAFLKLVSVQSLQKRYLKEAEAPSGNWWDNSLKAEAYRHPISGQTLVSVYADNGGSCSDFSASEWAIFELRNGKLTRLRAGMSPAHVARALDVDGDGRLELLVDQWDLGTDAALVSPDESWIEPRLIHDYQDCPC